MNQYYAFIKIIELGSFTKAAEELKYTQSAISQMVKCLETELNTKLIIRSRHGVVLTPDGEEFYPYIKRLHNAYRELMEKSREMQGLEAGIIRIGTFSSVSSSWFPQLIKEFKEIYPLVKFELLQGEYTSITELIKEGSVDFGFVNPDVASNLQVISLKQDKMLAILPLGHKLAKHKKITLNQLSKEPFILLDEGELSIPLKFFKKNGLHPNVQYRVYDDYTIMSLVEKDLGIAILPESILEKMCYNIVKKEICPPIVRTIGIAFKDKNTMPIASRYFIDFIVKKLS